MLCSSFHDQGTVEALDMFVASWVTAYNGDSLISQCKHQTTNSFSEMWLVRGESGARVGASLKSFMLTDVVTVHASVCQCAMRPQMVLIRVYSWEYSLDHVDSDSHWQGIHWQKLLQTSRVYNGERAVVCLQRQGIPCRPWDRLLEELDCVISVSV